VLVIVNADCKEGFTVFRSRSFLKNSRKMSSVAALGLSALLLVSCGGDDEEDTPTEAPVEAAPTEAAEETPTEAAEASPTADSATPVSGVASPVVASPVAGGATPVDTGMSVIPSASTPLVIASPVASPAASPVASPAS